MSRDSHRQKSTASLLSFIFTILFVLHVMVLPVWLGIRGIMIFKTDDSLLSIFPLWFVVSAIVCLAFALIFGMLPEYNNEPD